MKQASALGLRLGGRNIYLVGMMGSGKSTVGRPLAEALGYGFIDADTTIEACAGQTISELFASEGEAAFRALETSVLNQIACRHSLVVATGGGIVTQPVNWGHMHQGAVVWLDPSHEVLLQRIRASPGSRPLLEDSMLDSRIEELLTTRRPLYAQADGQLPIGNESPETVVSALLTLLDRMVQPLDAGGSRRTANH